VQGAFFSGANPIIAVDISDYKLKAARDFGATHTINANKEDAVKAVQQLTSGRGADYVFVTVGNSLAMQQGFAMSAKRGTTVIVGAAPIKEQLTISPFDFIEMEKTLTGAAMGSTRLSVDVPRLMALYQAGRLKLDELITDRYSLDQVDEAMEATEHGEALRNLLVF
jgi:Zn-dependent alcohol dehydrogenase